MTQSQVDLGHSFFVEKRTVEGMASRGAPLRFAPFRPLPLSPASPLSRELVSNGSLPLPLCGGAQAPWRPSLPPPAALTKKRVLGRSVCQRGNTTQRRKLYLLYKDQICPFSAFTSFDFNSYYKKCLSIVPAQDYSHPWTDEMLYKKYNLSEEEIAFIESMIRPME